MNKPQANLRGVPKPVVQQEKRIPSTDELISPQFVLALCSPIGSPTHEIAQQIKDELEGAYEYGCEIIRLSKIIQDQTSSSSRKRVIHKTEQEEEYLWIQEAIDEKLAQLPGNHSEEYLKKVSLITAGNEIRSAYDHLSPLASFAISEVNNDRLNNIEDSEVRSQIIEKIKSKAGFDTLTADELRLYKTALVQPVRKCFIIDSLKNSDELKVLRDTYGRSLLLLGISSSVSDRKALLADSGLENHEIELLINQDSAEDKHEGQNVRDIFCESDYFLRVGNQETVRREKVSRMLKVLFDSDLVTPDRHETAMYHATSSAGNSACMSRQVGAAITRENGELLSVGWNDVPKFGGNLYRSEDQNDSRCFVWDKLRCHNDFEKSKAAKLIADSLVEAGVLKENALGTVDDDIKELAIKSIRKSTRFSNLLEFSRSIHAEMHAILSAKRDDLLGSSLYCTTYPCHSCARHIVASGVKEVFYIEPYQKSLATKLHIDSITEEEQMPGKVRILVFEGVAPRRYMDLFKTPAGRKRKEDGMLKKLSKKEAFPSICQSTLASVSALEHIAIEALRDKMLELSRPDDLFNEQQQ